MKTCDFSRPKKSHFDPENRDFFELIFFQKAKNEKPPAPKIETSGFFMPFLLKNDQFLQQFEPKSQQSGAAAETVAAAEWQQLSGQASPSGQPKAATALAATASEKSATGIHFLKIMSQKFDSEKTLPKTVSAAVEQKTRATKKDAANHRFFPKKLQKKARPKSLGEPFQSLKMSLTSSSKSGKTADRIGPSSAADEKR